MKRRLFAIALSAPVTGFVLPSSAQDRPVEGRHYAVLQSRQPTRDTRQVEVLEFFAYSCGHCNAFEPALDGWQRKLPRDVLFRRIPVAFRNDGVIHQKLYFAIEGMGLVEELHPKVFAAIHTQRIRLDTPEQIGAFAAVAGVDRARFLQALDSFAVLTKVKQATALVSGYGVSGTPSIGVNGRWLTSGSMAGSNPKSLEVAEYLIERARKGA
ncbi:thiol:disulfide interchange protein DsbA/DsbL [Piscinibacter koreensis]|uniref:Thiol:disulfide interchange protein n=1 Tax=Piscinibacter koreensis TaxID=2742824 RepID=A0A7Y6NS94_9BURK|nr:thiol:disulfide interchange protein DsbA/DsbL [Schlegelella koreensis]NUZ08395.1 thiol:disulfide interchange protein DsbA/DsbL [Schlegelella koreensis]